MLSLRDIRNGLVIACWFVFLTFPLLVIKINPIENIVVWRWINILYVSLGSFLTYLYVCLAKKNKLYALLVVGWSVFIALPFIRRGLLPEGQHLAWGNLNTLYLTAGVFLVIVALRIFARPERIRLLVLSWTVFFSLPILLLILHYVSAILTRHFSGPLIPGIPTTALAEPNIFWQAVHGIYGAVGCLLCYLTIRVNSLSRWQQTTNRTGHRSVRWSRYLYRRKIFVPLLAICLLFFLCFPFFFSTYQVNIMSTALMYVVLGLGLNIVVGVAGLLDLGYVAFYAVGAYTYALLNMHFDLGFWTILPLGGILGAFFGILLGIPVLRLRGDYLAIVTLGFGEIIRLVLENWNDFSQGPSGISNIDRPFLPGVELSLEGSITYIYYLIILMVVFTIFVVNRLQDSRIGRAWFALREDEIACQAMGIDKMKTKLTAFALGATWAGMAGVFFAAKTTFINPASFTFLESAIILCIVVLGGMGSIVGVIISALILILLPEYLRAFSDYRMLVFGAVLVAMMVFRPQGLISSIRRTYSINEENG